jgi:hypothetical protein
MCKCYNHCMDAKLDIKFDRERWQAVESKRVYTQR